MFYLQRHSDHHAHPVRRYQGLRHFAHLPNGYFGMFAVFYLPPLWFWMMDKRLLRVVGRDPSRINFDPSRREALIRQYGLAETRGAA